MKSFHPRLAIKDLKNGTVMRWPSFSYGVLPVTIVILALIACLVAYSFATANLEDSRARATARTLRENELRIDGVMDSYAHVLWANAGRVQSGSVDELSWKTFNSVYNLKKNFTGMEAISLSYGDSPSNQTITYVMPETDATVKTIGYNMGQMPALAIELRKGLEKVVIEAKVGLLINFGRNQVEFRRLVF